MKRQIKPRYRPYQPLRRRYDRGAGCRRFIVGVILTFFVTVVVVALYQAASRPPEEPPPAPTLAAAQATTFTPAPIPTLLPQPTATLVQPTAVLASPSPSPSPTPAGPTAVALASIPLPNSPDALRVYLQAVPVLNLPGDHAREVFRRGQNLGNARRVLTKIGDCNSDSRAFLAPLDLGNYDLGPYPELQAVVDFFAGSFRVDSIADGVGFTAYSVLDWGFADPQYCQPRESPTACELRRRRPSVAIIMFGANDVRYLTAEQYADSMRQIVRLLLDQGTIPVLNTFAWCAGNMLEDKALELNAITVNLAVEYATPLINFWRAAQALPDCGLITETHLTSAGPPGGAPFVGFANGEERLAGYSLRNLLTLQMLDLLRRDALI